MCALRLFFFFFFNDTATTEIYTLSLHDALPICLFSTVGMSCSRPSCLIRCATQLRPFAITRGAAILSGLYSRDRKSTRLNSSHSQISYAVFCLKKKNRLSVAAGQLFHPYKPVTV